MIVEGAPRAHGLVEKVKLALGLWLLEKRGGEAAPGCLMIVAYEGARRLTRLESASALAFLRRRAMLVAGLGPARAWFAERFRHPYLRDELMGRGVLVETLETATTWEALGALYDGVRSALTRAMETMGTPGRVLCHLSHAYPHGASLYFTILARALAGEEIRQWRALKEAATGEIVRQGGALSHHHGIGVDHVRWLEAQLGADGVKLLRALKRELDPRGILNPGKLLPAPSV
jgi:alkyldihydroxyacetonephosphate synthase